MTAPHEEGTEMPAPAKKAAPAAPVKPAEKPAEKPAVDGDEQAPAAGEPTDAELEAADKYGITVAQLRDIRAEFESTIAVAAVEPAKPDVSGDAFCGVCMPGGWPEGGDHMDCPHGTWTRGKTKS